MGEIRTAVEFAPHQKEALGKMKDGCILWGGVGAGKSRVGMGYYCLTEEHEDLVVITTAKKRDSLDWETEAARFGVGREREASFAGTITVDSWNNIEKYVDTEGAFFIFDEQRLVGSGKWSKSFLKIAKKNRWIMLSATPGDTWLDYIPVFVANGFYKNRTEFKREHVIFKPFSKYPVVERYIGVQRLVRHRNSILIHMPYERETVRHGINIWCEHDEVMLARVSHGRWNPFEDRPILDVADMFHQMRKVVNTDPSRLRALWKLLDKHDRLIVFYNFDYELAILRTIKGSDGREYAEYNGHKHEPIPTADKWIYVVQYIAGSEAWDCTTTNSICFWSLTYSYKMWEQTHGRIDRLDTEYTDLFYYYFRSKAPIDWAIWRSLKAKRSFQTKDFDLTDEEFAENAYQGPNRREEWAEQEAA